MLVTGGNFNFSWAKIDVPLQCSSKQWRF